LEENGGEQGNINDDEAQSNEEDAGDGAESDENEDTQSTEDETWSLDKLKAYLVWIKSTFHPKLTPPAEQVLVSYYQLQRKTDLRNAARTTIRLLESLIRLSQAHARLMARDYVTIQDAVVIVSLMEVTAQGGAAMLNGINPLHASFPKSGEEEYQRQEEVMLQRLGLSHLGSPSQSSREADLESNSDGENGRNGAPSLDSAIRDDPSSSPSSSGARLKRRRESEDDYEDQESVPHLLDRDPGESMVLDDQAEMEMLERLRRLDKDEVLVEPKEEEEEPLIDRRWNRWKATSDVKGKGVFRG
jgi:DNA helicase MCM9